MRVLDGVMRWAGGALFVLALAVCFYSFAVRWGRPAPFAPAAVAFDIALFTLFAAHHSVFARAGVKRSLARLVPARLERSFYVWVASLLLLLTCLAWQPVGGEVFGVHGVRAAAHAAVETVGLLMIAGAVRAIDPLELAGIRSHAGGEALQISGPYRLVRHPLYLGWLLATFGAGHMTGDRLLFAGISVFYLAVAVPFEERSLVLSFGEQYRRYQQTVRWRIVPYVY
jgi:protein-S-isoprenylcysteine O-methyltransferase Ste14